MWSCLSSARTVVGHPLQRPPFVDDTAPLILREYVNAVLTGASWAEETRLEVTRMLESGDIRAR